MEGIIYQATNIVNGKSYIGQTTCELAKRKSDHRYEANNGSPYYFHKAIRKHSFDSFEWSVLEEGRTIDELNLLEPGYIEKLGTLSPSGYNLTTGGKNGRCSDVTKKKMSFAKMGNKNNLGHKHTEEAKKKIGIAHLGKKTSEETKKKMSIACRGERSPCAKLTEEQVLEIHIELMRGARQCILAKKFGVSQTTIHDIRYGRTWKHLL